MAMRHSTCAIVALLVAAVPTLAQPAAELLQKGIYTQETLGNVDSAIQIYRQVIASSGTPKAIAAQAQYQLVLSMLQKGDRTAAAREMDLLARDFPNQQDLIDKARKLVPGGGTLLPAPWVDGESSELTVKRNGVSTGEYLYYMATPWRLTVDDYNRDPAHNHKAIDNALTVELSWRLVTSASTRSVRLSVDRDTMRRLSDDVLDSNDDSGDGLAEAFAGPAVDVEPLVFRMRVLPLAVGYKAAFTTLPYLIGHGVPRTVEMAVTGVETVTTPAGSFKCYRVSFASLGQTFWIGVEGARPFVKFQSGSVEAELAGFWGSKVLDQSLDFLGKAGWIVSNLAVSLGSRNLEVATASASAPGGSPYGKARVDVEIRRMYTPPAEIDSALRKDCSGAMPGSIQTHTLGHYAAISCLGLGFHIWVRTQTLILRFSPDSLTTVPTFRWMFEPVLDTIKLP